MDVPFLDRLLVCSDCKGEFIFTAGEQLFFQDKQFKNDPKRCKPCKVRRSSLAAAASGLGLSAAELSRTETRTQCSECEVETTVPFKPTQGRPVLCRRCFQAKSSSARSTAATVSALTEASTNSGGQSLSAAAALLAAVSMASASASSSVSSAADLALISAGGEAPARALPSSGGQRRAHAPVRGETVEAQPAIKHGK